jgi:hypothetical protein
LLAVAFESNSVREFSPAGDTCVGKRARKVLSFHVHAHVSDGPIAEDAAEGAAPLVVRRPRDEPVKVFQTAQHQLI